MGCIIPPLLTLPIFWARFLRGLGLSQTSTGLVSPCTLTHLDPDPSSGCFLMPETGRERGIWEVRLLPTHILAPAGRGRASSPIPCQPQLPQR